MNSRAISIILLIAVVALLATGCGGGSSSTSSAEPTGSGSVVGQKSGSTAPTKAFLGPGQANKQARFGHVSTPEEFEEATKVVEANLKARDDHDWAGQCATFSRKVIKLISETPGTEKRHACGAKLGTLAEGVPQWQLEDNLQKRGIIVVRVEGDRGYAFYHGTDKIDWAMPLQREDGVWKVTGLEAERLPRIERTAN